MPTDIFPEIDIPVISVIFSYGGISADEMDKRIVTPFERFHSPRPSTTLNASSQSLNGIAVVKVFSEDSQDRRSLRQITGVADRDPHHAAGHATATGHSLQREQRTILRLSLRQQRCPSSNCSALHGELHPPPVGDDPEPLPSGAASSRGTRPGTSASTAGPERNSRILVPFSFAPPILVRFVSAGGEPRPRWAPGFSIDGVEVPLYIARFEKSGGDTVSRPDGTFRLAGIPSSGLLVLWPFGIPELSMTRPLPVVEEIVFTVPAR